MAAASMQLPGLQVPSSNTAKAQSEPPDLQQQSSGRMSTGLPQTLPATQQAPDESALAHSSQAHIMRNVLNAFDSKPS